MAYGRSDNNSWSVFEQIIDASPAMIWITDNEGHCIYLSKQWYVFTGESENKSLGSGWLNTLHPDDKARVENSFNEALQQRTAFSSEYRLRTASGTYRWVRDIGNPRFESQGEFSGFSGTVYDIHDQKIWRQDVALKNEAIENSLNGFDIVNAEGKFIYANKAYLDMWRYDSLDEILNTSPADHCADPSVPQKIIEELKAVGHCTTEFLAKRKDGTVFDVLMSARLAYDPEGNEIYPTTSMDISRKKSIEEKLRASEQTLRLITNAIPDLISYIDKDCKYKFVNQAYGEKFGLSLDQAIGKHVRDVWPKIFDRMRPNIEKALNGEHVHVLRQMEDKQKKICHFDIKYIPDLAPDKTVQGFVVIGHDITALVKAKESAEKANQLKSSFLANMSHEIRTPLGAIIGFTDLLRNPHLSADEKNNYIGIMQKNGEQLAMIINDILDLSKVEAGHLTLEYQKIDPRALVREVVSLLEMRAKEKNLTLGFTFDVGVPDFIVTDPLRVRQILVNLVGNAIKFTHKGRIDVKVYSSQTEAKKLSCVFEIEDTGIGIADKNSERIFEVFVQADDSMTRRFGGTGLGLALSRRLSRALGGDVILKASKEHRGTTMVFSIEDQPEKIDPSRAMIKAAGRIDEVDPSVFKGSKILVVDDVPDNQFLLSHFLTALGAKVDFASNGQEAYDRALQDDYAVVLMDIQMPEMDGYTATSKLRIAGYRKPIIALTAHAMTEVRTKCLNVGCSDYLSKPINQKDLKNVVGRHLAKLSSEI